MKVLFISLSIAMTLSSTSFAACKINLSSALGGGSNVSNAELHKLGQQPALEDADYWIDLADDILLNQRNIFGAKGTKFLLFIQVTNRNAALVLKKKVHSCFVSDNYLGEECGPMYAPRLHLKKILKQLGCMEN